jgi:hypothetical protein
MRRASFILVSFAILVLACSRTGNDERAYFVKRGTTYVVEMRGRRRLLSHDPLSAIRGRTYEETLTIELPRIEGVIEGAEIPVRSGYLRYAGRVAITNRKMKVDLSYQGEANARVALLWNGDYTLVQRDTRGVP